MYEFETPMRDMINKVRLTFNTHNPSEPLPMIRIDLELISSQIQSYFEMEDNEDEKSAFAVYLAELISLIPYGYPVVATLMISLGALVEAGATLNETAIGYFVASFVGLLIELCPQYLKIKKKCNSSKVSEHVKQILEAQCESMSEGIDKVEKSVVCITSRYALARELMRQHANFPELQDLMTKLRFEFKFLFFATHLLHDEPLLIIHPIEKWGVRAKISCIISNWILHMATAYFLKQQFPSLSIRAPRLEQVEYLLGQNPRAKGSMYWVFEMYNWTALDSLPSSDDDEEGEKYFNKGLDHKIWAEGIPEDITKFEGIRVILLGPLQYQRSCNLTTDFSAQKASFEIEQQLSKDEIETLLTKMVNVSKEEKRRILEERSLETGVALVDNDLCD
ncbi:hypothetical protein FDP41_012423 [Naegleria fowleri]|uniref:Uncharacterized protein n=1 Tax=Naegleria fowleri TaxID=5763 RepID=A0A6A5C264_NAEFO|nr:uncharacterized protein FDP41_012423 [Naegleria fowleri]KAF0981766.1 hypothetical protein FDP41_012423 [Naegleria fowleri]